MPKGIVAKRQVLYTIGQGGACIRDSVNKEYSTSHDAGLPARQAVSTGGGV